MIEKAQTVIRIIDPKIFLECATKVTTLPVTILRRIKPAMNELQTPSPSLPLPCKKIMPKKN